MVALPEITTLSYPVFTLQGVSPSMIRESISQAAIDTLGLAIMFPILCPLPRPWK